MRRFAAILIALLLVLAAVPALGEEPVQELDDFTLAVPEGFHFTMGEKAENQLYFTVLKDDSSSQSLTCRWTPGTDNFAEVNPRKLAKSTTGGIAEAGAREGMAISNVEVLKSEHTKLGGKEAIEIYFSYVLNFSFEGQPLQVKRYQKVVYADDDGESVYIFTCSSLNESGIDAFASILETIEWK